MAGTERPPWRVVLPVLFTVITGLLFALTLVISEAAEAQNWDDSTVQTMSMVFKTLVVLNLVLLTEWIQRTFEWYGYGLLGAVDVTIFFTVEAVKIAFVSGYPLPAFVAGMFAVVYGLRLRRYDWSGLLRSSEVSE